MTIIKLNKNSQMESFLEVARLHISEIHHGFLPLLGEDFLSFLYFQLSQLDGSGLWVAEENGKIQGFLLGTADFKKIYLEVFKKAWVKFIAKGFLSIFKKNVLSKLPTILLYPFKKHDKNEEDSQNHTNAELLAIAVNTTSKGKGVGKALVFTFESAIREWGIIGDYFVTTNASDPDSTAFYKKMGFMACGNQKHNDLTLQVFKKPITLDSRKG